jgi:DNA-binding transcriptional regulator YiaG
MMSEPSKPGDKREPRQRKYPIRCIECGQKEVRPAVIPYSLKKNHDGRLYDLHVPDLQVIQCGKCGAVYTSNDADEQICAALRAELHLLSPDEIRDNLALLKLNQKDFAEVLGVAAESVSRWVTGMIIQSKAMDNLMRLFFSVPNARRFLRGRTPVRKGAAVEQAAA